MKIFLDNMLTGMAFSVTLLIGFALGDFVYFLFVGHSLLDFLWK